MSSDFGNSRNRFRRVYGYNRPPPEPFTFIDLVANTTRSFDKHSIIHDRDFYILRGAELAAAAAIVYGQYDEANIFFNNTTSATGSFNITFSDLPVIVLTIDPPTGSTLGNIIPFLMSSSATTLQIGLSAPYSGNVRYRAIYNASYPVAVQNQPNFPGMTFMCSAGTVDTHGATTWSASFPSVGAIPSQFLYTPFDISGSSTGDVYLSASSLTATVVSGTISAPYTNRINYIAYL